MSRMKSTSRGSYEADACLLFSTNPSAIFHFTSLREKVQGKSICKSISTRVLRKSSRIKADECICGRMWITLGVNWRSKGSSYDKSHERKLIFVFGTNIWDFVGIRVWCDAQAELSSFLDHKNVSPHPTTTIQLLSECHSLWLLCIAFR